MNIQRAKKFHLSGINRLIAMYGFVPLKPEFLNQRDIGVVATGDNGAIVGFTWLGLMAGNRLAYSDYTVIDPVHGKAGIALAMFKYAVQQSRKVGCATILAGCKRDEHHGKLMSSALKMGMKADAAPYTVMVGDVAECAKILGVA